LSPVTTVVYKNAYLQRDRAFRREGMKARKQFSRGLAKLEFAEARLFASRPLRILGSIHHFQARNTYSTPFTLTLQLLE